MKARQVLIHDQYDVVVVGGGIYGAAHAWEAASRGLSVILLEKGDFGSATSANSLKVIHGGIRYLQTLNIKRVLDSKRERDTYMRIAPHLVQPMECIMPSYPWTAKGKLATAVGALLYNLLSRYDDWVSKTDSKGLEARRVSRVYIGDNISAHAQHKTNGGTQWYDAQVYDSERMVLSFIMSAKARGAHVYNYMAVSGLVLNQGRVEGVSASDLLSGGPVTVNANFVIDATGPWSKLNHHKWLPDGTAQGEFAKAVNLVYPFEVSNKAFGAKVQSSSGTGPLSSRLLFSAPWKGSSMVGTWYFPAEDPEKDNALTQAQLDVCVEDVVTLCSLEKDLAIKPSHVHIGLVPVKKRFKENVFPMLSEETITTDHKKVSGLEGLVSVFGVKYTTARSVAEKTIDLVEVRSGKCGPASVSRYTPLYGGEIKNFSAFQNYQQEKLSGLVDKAVIENMTRHYGTNIDRIMSYVDKDEAMKERIPGTPCSIKAEVLYVLEHEMVVKLTDLMVRRLGIGGLGQPSESAIEYCAGVMADALSWNASEKQSNIDELRDYYRRVPS
ncbi:MAG: FAD-dependent oxidoreductase [Gammaproteobacteria bacterium]|nr:FAD-dependent oxidoreductase [Gammaproteobacteria bacterium]